MEKNKISEKLFEMQDLKYRDFQIRLMPTVAPECVIGVRTPELRRFARELSHSKCEVREFLNALPHRYYEENNLHAFLIEQISDYETVLKEVNRFLPFIDNWATCDSMSPKVFSKNTDKLITDIEKWIHSDDTYAVRFGVEMLMSHYLGDNFKTEYLSAAAAIKSDEYYINMMVAWYFATALAKQYEKTVPFIEKNVLPRWTHNKTISKATESYRITDAEKAYLKTLKRIN